MRMLMTSVLFAACSSGSSTPSSSTPSSSAPSAPTAPSTASESTTPAGGSGSSTQVLTKEECEAQGGRVNASIGGGDQAHCNPDENEIAQVRLGVEGGWCCKQK